jgi:glycosyltransferase involved in cell wall biosynthesis
LISFIIPAHNEEALLGRTLASIHRAAPRVVDAFEVIVVDDASTDRTAQVARRAGAEVVRVDCRQIAAARNAGARRARGDVLVFVDADTVLPERTLRAAVRALQRGAAGGGATFSFDRGASPWLETLTATFAGLMRLFNLAPGCFLFVRREAFDAVGGFDQRLFASEELAFSRAVGRIGRFQILCDRVITSGRKVRAKDVWRRVLRLTWRWALEGDEMLKRREGLDLWYDSARSD